MKYISVFLCTWLKANSISLKNQYFKEPPVSDIIFNVVSATVLIKTL